MKLPAKSVAWLLPLFLTACLNLAGHKPVQTLPPSIHATLSTAPIKLPDSVLVIPTQPLISDIPELPQQSFRSPIKHRKAAGDTLDATIASPGIADAAMGESAIGELSSGDPPDLSREIVNSITATEYGLSSLHRPLNTQERKTVVQIRQFLKHAKVALTSGDVDGAHTLAAKAQLLLSELQL